MFFFGLRRPRARLGAGGTSYESSASAAGSRTDDDVRRPAVGDRRDVRAARSLLACALLAGDLHALGTLARACVRLRLLAPHGQATAVAQAAVTADLLEAFDVLRALAPQVTLHGQTVVDRVAEFRDLVLGE